jgi:hypothetical protein
VIQKCEQQQCTKEEEEEKEKQSMHSYVHGEMLLVDALLHSFALNS